jgi:DNA-binding transcriptional regulator YiaG
MTSREQKVLNRAHDNLLAAIIRDWQEKEKLTNLAAANKLGVPMRTYGDWKGGQHSPRGFALKKLYEIIGLAKRRARHSNNAISKSHEI